MKISKPASVRAMTIQHMKDLSLALSVKTRLKFQTAAKDALSHRLNRPIPVKEVRPLTHRLTSQSRREGSNSQVQTFPRLLNPIPLICRLWSRCL